MMLSALRSINMASRALGVVLFPLLLLGMRLWLAQIFLLAAALKLAAPGQPAPSSLYACFEGWLNAGSAAVMIVIWITVMGALLLAAGLATRLAALALAMVALAAFVFDAGAEQNFLWALMLGFVALLGAGPLSLDAAFRRGAGRNAIFGLLRLHAPLRLDRVRGIALLLLRLWLALVLLNAARAPSGASAVPQLLAPHAMAFGPPGEIMLMGLAVLAAVSLIPGLLVRPAAGLAALVVLAMALHAGRQETLYIAALLGILAGAGPGALALESALKLDRWPSFGLGEDEAAPHVVVVGAGFGGLATVFALMRHRCHITLIDRRNHHLFQPLLYQVATAALSPGDITLPVRALFRGQRNVRVLLGEVHRVDRTRRIVHLSDRTIAYDYLVIATGARTGYHGKAHWAPWAPGLKQIEDATHVRSRLLAAFEHAEDAETEDARRAWLTFVIVGAGPTGVEMAGALAELARHGLTGEFRHIDPASARIIVLNRGERCLAAFPPGCSRRTEDMLNALGVEVRHGAVLQSLDANGVVLADGSRIAARTVLWTAGVEASPAARWLGLEAGPGGRVPVTSRLSLEGDERVFVIGDTALAPDGKGGFAPGLAPAAKQQGAYAARVIAAAMAGRRPPRPFRYRHQGSLATIGRSSAVADFGWIRLSGAPAWWLWGLVHVGYLTGARNRIAVALQWFWAYITYHRSTRLITGSTTPTLGISPEGDNLKQALEI